MIDQNNSEGAIMVHYENNIHLQNEEHTPKCKLFQFFQLNYTLSKQTSSSNILKWFNMHSGWPRHGFSKTAPKLKPGGENKDCCQGDSQRCWGAD